jgi:putative hydrolase of the HAD superfamily
VLFDLDNTLIDRVGAFRRWATIFVAERNLGAAEVEWLERTDHDGFKPRPQFFDEVRTRFDLLDPLEKLLADYGRRYPRCVTPPPPQTFTALRTLRESGWKVGVITNGAPTQAIKFAAAALTESLDGWVISEVVGARKPEPALFIAAAEACGAELDGAWMVGDSPEADILGAVNCGIRSIWIARGRRWPLDTCRPTATVDTIPEAVAHILAQPSVTS